MASDADYAAFLEKANQDMGAAANANASAQSSTERYKTRRVDTEVPEVLMQVQEYYVSDADEEFEPVALAFEGGDVDIDDLRSLIHADVAIEALSEQDFDPHNSYASVIDAVKKACDGKVRVFKVRHTETRSEYYVVGVDREGKRVVGMKAVAVES